MKTIWKGDLERCSFPSGAHVVEVVASSEQCRLHSHFPGVNCVQLAGLRQFMRSHRKEEPVVVHCEGAVDCRLAVGMLEYAGFDEVYRYEGELLDLKPYGWRETKAEEKRISAEAKGFRCLPPWAYHGEPEAPAPEEPVASGR